MGASDTFGLFEQYWKRLAVILAAITFIVAFILAFNTNPDITLFASYLILLLLIFARVVIVKTRPGYSLKTQKLWLIGYISLISVTIAAWLFVPPVNEFVARVFSQPTPMPPVTARHESLTALVLTNDCLTSEFYEALVEKLASNENLTATSRPEELSAGNVEDGDVVISTECTNDDITLRIGLNMVEDGTLGWVVAEPAYLDATWPKSVDISILANLSAAVIAYYNGHSSVALEWLDELTDADWNQLTPDLERNRLRFFQGNVHLRIGNSFLAQGLYEAALHVLDPTDSVPRSDSRFPLIAQLHINLANAYTDQDVFDKAQDELEFVLEPELNNPNQPQEPDEIYILAWMNLSQLHWNFIQSNTSPPLDRAEHRAHAQEACERLNGRDEPHWHICVAGLADRQSDPIQVLNAVADANGVVNSDYAAAYYYAGRGYCGRGTNQSNQADIGTAIEMYNEALQRSLDPELTNAIDDGLGSCKPIQG